MRAMLPVLSGGLAAAALAWCAPVAAAQDTLYRKGGGTIGQAGGIEIIDLEVDKIYYRLKGVSKQSVDASQVQGWEFGEPPKVYDDGKVAFDEGRWGDAASAFAQAASREHKQKWVQPLATYYRGEALRNAGAFSQAIDAYRQYLQNFSNHIMLPQANIGIGQCYLATRKNAEARKAFDVVAGGKYGDAHALTGEIWKARVLEAEGKWSEAKSAYTALERKAGSIDKDAAVAAGVRKNLAAVQLGITGKDDGALTSARSALQANLRALAEGTPRPDLEAAAWNGIGETYFYVSTPDWVEAVVAFSHVWVRFPDQYDEVPKALYHAAHAYFNAADKIGSDPEWSKRKAFALVGKLRSDFPRSQWTKKPTPK